MADFTKTIQEIIDMCLTRVRSETGPNSKLFPQALQDFNLALQELAILHTWKWMRKEVNVDVPAGTRLVNDVTDFPTDVINYESLMVNNFSGPLRQISEIEANELFPDKETQGTPQYYMIGPVLINDIAVPIRTIELRPVPIEDITLQISYTYTFKLYEDVDCGSVPPIPANYYSPLIELVASRLLRHMKNPRVEIQDAEQKAYGLISVLAKKDADKNKSVKAIRLPRAMRIYRARRYD